MTEKELDDFHYKMYKDFWDLIDSAKNGKEGRLCIEIGETLINIDVYPANKDMTKFDAMIKAAAKNVDKS